MAKKTKSDATREFTVTGEVTISVSKRVRATSAEEAKDIADTLGMPGLCHQCSHAGNDDAEAWELDGLDGEAVNVRVEE